MALDMNNATYARSLSGLKAMVDNVTKDLDKTIAQLQPKGAFVANLESTIRKYWVGEDAEQWIKEFETNVTNCKNVVTKMKNIVSVQLPAEYKEFQAFQSSNR